MPTVLIDADGCPVVDLTIRICRAHGVPVLILGGDAQQPHNFISGCSAVGSAPALGAGCRRFESCHSDQISQKSRLFMRFFCVFCSIFSVLLFAVSW